MGTIILSILIFGFVAWIIYKYAIKKESTCDCSSVDCPISKSNQKKKTKDHA
ncbi:FeoB-associated Cys-rich membrane protein [Vagococcus silagei]|uniref:FeoB-associated Cys-rich membrane protein n=1 Tax=Vagococcus silagei TaxID=2508885 RepID=UPI001EF3FCDB|nr:FeoB-associated Cys-rich membrane protein [Vagococcus silagei]